VNEWMAQGGAPDAVVDGATLLQWCAYCGDVSAIKARIAGGESLHSLGVNVDLDGAASH
jgi:hypothetical protein